MDDSDGDIKPRLEEDRECECGSHYFVHENGQVFCWECQCELEGAREIFYDVDYEPEVEQPTQRSRVLRTTVKKDKSKKKISFTFIAFTYLYTSIAVNTQELPTSWECFNQLLCNLVDEIEEIEENIFSNVNSDFKLTVLQLWAAYLRHHGKAFFSKETVEYPQFDARYKIV